MMKKVHLLIDNFSLFFVNSIELSLKSALLKFVEDLSYTFPNFFGESTSQISEFISSDGLLLISLFYSTISNFKQMNLLLIQHFKLLQTFLNSFQILILQNQ